MNERRTWDMRLAKAGTMEPPAVEAVSRAGDWPVDAAGRGILGGKGCFGKEIF
jgi:hypothetical protein